MKKFKYDYGVILKAVSSHEEAVVINWSTNRLSPRRPAFMSHVKPDVSVYLF